MRRRCEKALSLINARGEKRSRLLQAPCSATAVVALPATPLVPIFVTVASLCATRPAGREAVEGAAERAVLVLALLPAVAARASP